MKKTSRTKTYLLPTFMDYFKFDRNNVNNLLLGIEGKTKSLSGTVFLWVKTLTDEYTKVEEFVQVHRINDEFVVEYYYPDKEHYQLFIDGLYSQFSSKNKILIIKYFNLTKSDKIVKILEKHPSLKAKLEAELRVDLKGYELGEKIKIQDELFKTTKQEKI